MSDEKKTFADKEDIAVERFIEALLDNHIVPKRSGDIDVLNRAQRKMLNFPCIKDAYDMVHDSMIKVHDYQNICWDDLLNCIKEIVTKNDQQKINEREQYYKNECTCMLEDFIKCYGDNAKDAAKEFGKDDIKSSSKVSVFEDKLPEETEVYLLS